MNEFDKALRIIELRYERKITRVAMLLIALFGPSTTYLTHFYKVPFMYTWALFGLWVILFLYGVDTLKKQRQELKKL